MTVWVILATSLSKFGDGTEARTPASSVVICVLPRTESILSRMASAIAFGAAIRTSFVDTKSSMVTGKPDVR